jgi:hypothetical protein
MGLDIYFSKQKKEEEDTWEELAYFRKVNCLVAFFEKHYGYDRNDVEMPITKEMCKHLVELCQLALDNPEEAEKYMPNTGGFFFGSTLYDDSYFEDLGYVIESVKKSVIPAFHNLKDDEEIVFVTSW